MYGVPTLSPHAVLTYLALGLGAALGLLLRRALTGFEARAEFRNDVLVSDNWTRPIPPPPAADPATVVTPPSAPRE
jgi:hypothetical protein